MCRHPGTLEELWAPRQDQERGRDRGRGGPGPLHHRSQLLAGSPRGRGVPGRSKHITTSQFTGLSGDTAPIPLVGPVALGPAQPHLSPCCMWASVIVQEERIYFLHCGLQRPCLGGGWEGEGVIYLSSLQPPHSQGLIRLLKSKRSHIAHRYRIRERGVEPGLGKGVC